MRRAREVALTRLSVDRLIGCIVLLATIPCRCDPSSPVTTRRELIASPGCQNCCFGHDCRLAFSRTSPGVCCGTHPRVGCCPLGFSCVNCGASWRCSRSFVSHSARSRMCHASGYGPGYGHSYGPHYHDPHYHDPHYHPHYYVEADGNAHFLHSSLAVVVVVAVASLAMMFIVVRRMSSHAMM